MKGAELENFRLALLKIAEANSTRHGLGAMAFKLWAASTYGFPHATLEEVQRELAYLKDKNFLSEPPKSLSPENRVWQITAAGRDFLATNE